MNVAFLRHGKTQGNLEHRYVGSTDYPLCGEGVEELRALLGKGIYPEAEHLYVSPLVRCRETGGLLYPGVPSTLLDGLREQHYGEFENKSYSELEHDPAFRAWIDAAGGQPPPGGESPETLAERTGAALEWLLRDAREKGYGSIAVVTHGGVMMSLFSRYARPARDFYSWQAGNGRGFLFEPTAAGRTLALLKTIDCEEVVL